MGGDGMMDKGVKNCTANVAILLQGKFGLIGRRVSSECANSLSLKGTKILMQYQVSQGLSTRSVG